MTEDEINDAIRKQVDSENPFPAGGFETDSELETYKSRCEARFFELVQNPSQWNF
jgi:hypothetical protein